MDYYFEHEAPIGGQGVDRHNRCRPSALLSQLQDAAIHASEDLRVSRGAMLARHNVFWMLARIWFRLDRPLGLQDRLQVRTWHRGGKGVTVYRDFDLYSGGQLVGEAVSSWVLADWDTKKLLRMSAVPEFAGSTGGSLCKERQLHKLHLPASMAEVERRLLRESDTDINGHVNNARYADFVGDALGLESLPPAYFVEEMQLGYLAECLPGETVTLSAAQTGDDAFVHGTGPGGDGRFDAWVRLGKH